VLSAFELLPFRVITTQAFPQNPNSDIELVVDPVAHLHFRMTL
jgi:hypothetical protein